MTLFILIGLTSSAFAQGIPVVIQTIPSANIQTILTALGGTLVDSMDDHVYLATVPAIPSVLPHGVKYIEPDNFQISGGKGAVFTVGATTPVNFYRDQPALQKINLPGVPSYVSGRGVVIADINAKVDVAHPALVGHLTAGAEFLSGNCTKGSSALNQGEGGFLDQAEGGFLDQAEGGFLDQAEGGFLDQAEAGFLDQSTASFLDQMSPAHGHGTMVAGILAAVAPDAMIMPLRAFDDRGCGSIYNIAKAVRYAVNHGAQVINMSFGVAGEGHTLKNAIADAVKAGVTVVASAGNDNTAVPQYPAAYPGVLSVAATDPADAKAPFSNFGPTVFVSAPGMNIISAYPGGYYAELSGTSFSAPMVAAEAALLRSEKTSGWTRSISTGVVNVDAVNPKYVGQLGSGRIDLVKALQ